MIDGFVKSPSVPRFAGLRCILLDDFLRDHHDCHR